MRRRWWQWQDSQEWIRLGFAAAYAAFFAILGILAVAAWKWKVGVQ